MWTLPSALATAGLFGADIGPLELLILLLVVLLLFGAKRLPELGRAIGRSMREFKKGLSDVTDEIEAPGDEKKVGETPSREITAEAAKSEDASKKETGPAKTDGK